MSAAAPKKYKFNFKFKPPVKPVKPNIVHVPKEQWQKEKRQLFIWADNKAAKHGLNANQLNILKTIISLTDSKGVTYATLETIHNRLIERYGKGAPSRATIDRAIVKFCNLMLIKRDTQKTFKGLVATRLLRYKLAMRSTSKCGTEYISTQKDIYIRKGDTSKIAAFPSNPIDKYSPESACSPALSRAAAADGEVVKRSDFERQEILKKIKAAQGR